jgi:MFS family permease
VQPIDTDIPARLDRLPWHRFHSRVVIALGITWVLDGLEVTLAGSLSGALKSSPMLQLTDAQVGLSASLYLVGAVTGALLFGWAADRFGRKRLFNVTLGVYLAGTALTALSFDFTSFAACRMLTGAGIGGEYTAINSAIQEMVPARYRGRTDLLINGSFWLGAAAGAGGSVLLLSPGLLPPDIGWRVAFGIGALTGTLILYLRRYVPESPRWLITHGRFGQAEQIVADIERQAGTGTPLEPAPLIALTTRVTRLADVARALARTYPRRSLHVLLLMSAQAFFYNAIFFTYALVLGRFFQVPDQQIGLYLLPFALANFAGPLLLGRLFDTVGRRPMIAATYGGAGVLLLVTAALFVQARLDATGMTMAWSVVFFVASAAASSAYLTAGESFPLEIRALSIALFYSLGTGIGGAIAPWLFGVLVGTGERQAIAWGYALGALLMLVAAGSTLLLGVRAECQPLESVAEPLSKAR